MTVAQLASLSKTQIEFQKAAQKGEEGVPQEGTVEDWAMLARLPLAG